MKALKKIVLIATLVLMVAIPTVLAQQVNVLTTGTGGVGVLMVGVATSGAARLFNRRTTLTNAQVIALNATSVSVAPAPGAGYVIDVTDGMLMFDYTAAYTESSDNLALYYGSNSRGIRGSNVIETTGFLDATADTIIAFSGTPDDTRPLSNTAVHIYNTTGVAFGGGNASNRVFVDVTYVVRQTGF